MDTSEAKNRRWGSLDQLRQQYPLGRTRAYELLKIGKLRAKRLGGRTIWDFDSVDALFASLPDHGTGA
ncbi:hypothetical protein IP68_03895 [Blastomonas sp. AAP25]|uniref:hypothetical protein n=1 Tax=Blastomonas sp. AAP25 TaxID=1523416 RepID=UPI0006BA0B87|nr:hypothetical protein [Blastomonas sp. AAP25]KPF76994.1 hypothetical protein IP68_03895 [Blastomonas sp. AAP25]